MRGEGRERALLASEQAMPPLLAVCGVACSRAYSWVLQVGDQTATREEVMVSTRAQRVAPPEGRHLVEGAPQAPEWIIHDTLVANTVLGVGLLCVVVGLALLINRFYFDHCKVDLYDSESFVPQPEWAGDDSIHAIVSARGQEAELEIRADAVDSYDKLRNMIVDSIPGMFNDTDELAMDYMDHRRSWVRVRAKTPLSVVKASANIRITCRKSTSNKHMVKKLARALTTA